MTLVSATRLRVRSVWTLPVFFLRTMQTGRQARVHPGSLAVAILNDTDRTFWTCSVWQDASAMRDYMLAGAHKEAMRKLAGWCDEASAVHWEQEAAGLPPWDEVHRRMQADGHPSRVAHPSAAHQAWRVRPPDPARVRNPHGAAEVTLGSAPR